MWCKHGGIFILAGIMLCPVPGRTERVWEYARDWEKNQAENKMQPAENMQKQAGSGAGPSGPHKKKARTGVRAKGSPATLQKASGVPVAVTPDKPAAKPVLVTTAAAPAAADPVRAGLWFRRLLDAVQLTPDEQTRRTAWRSLNEKYRSAMADIRQLRLRDGQRQALFETLQRRLKEEQRPELPENQRLREDFAEGMAAGMQVEALLSSRQALGLETDRTAFLAGLREAMRSDSRVTEDEYQRLLAGSRARLAQAEEECDRRRQAADKKWLTEFRRQPGVQQSSDAVFYRKVYDGNGQVDDEDVLTVGLVRRLTDNTVTEDSDITGRVLEARLKDYPPLLRSILRETGLHGEVQIAMPVDREGIPDASGPWTEFWTVRSLDATQS